MKKVLLIDNYDSFTWNLVQIFRELKTKVVVRKNDEINASEAEKLNPDFLIFSPGPGTVKNPRDIGNGLDIFKKLRGKIPILGVCLGHQMIGEFFGGKIKKTEPAHGKKSSIKILRKTGLFKNFPDAVNRFHDRLGRSLDDASGSDRRLGLGRQQMDCPADYNCRYGFFAEADPG